MLSPLLALAMMQQSKPHTGVVLYRSCRATVRVLDANPAGTDIPDSEFCRGYIYGLTETFTTVMQGSPFCFPSNATYGTAIRLYVRFMESNPKMMDQPQVVGMLASLHANYPCPAK
jgi:hypothetical protein